MGSRGGSRTFRQRRNPRARLTSPPNLRRLRVRCGSRRKNYVHFGDGERSLGSFAGQCRCFFFSLGFVRLAGSGGGGGGGGGISMGGVGVSGGFPVDMMVLVVEMIGLFVKTTDGRFLPRSHSKI